MNSDDYAQGSDASRLRFVFRCAAFSAIALLLGFLSGLVAVYIATATALALRLPFPQILPLILPLIIGGISHGAVYGFVQWRMLAPWGPAGRTWVAMSSLGWTAAYIALGLATMFTQFENIPVWVAGGALGFGGGAIVGTAQLIGTLTPSKGPIWVASNSVGLSLGAALVASLVSTIPYGQGPGEELLQGGAIIILSALAGAVVGIFTALSIIAYPTAAAR